jgi:uncharacterized protein
MATHGRQTTQDSFCSWRYYSPNNLTAPTFRTEAFDEFVSDPSKPVPYTMEITSAWAKDYMTEDQRFAAWRPDVLVYRGETLREDLTIAGSITADLWVSTSAGDADWIVKVIDEFPGAPLNGLKPNDPASDAFPSGRQQLLRAGCDARPVS